MYFRPLLLLIILFVSFRSNATDLPIVKKNDPYIKYLLAHPQDDYKFLDFNNNLLLNPNRLNEVAYIVTKEGILYKPIGTGFLFEIKKHPIDTQITVTRIDSTYYTGYNFLDFMFKRNDTIFSIGGEGFWNYNGQLRYFAKEKGEWELVPIQQWFPISTNDIVDIRIKKGRIYTYFLENKLNNIFTNQKENTTDSVIVFNLKNGSQTIIGSILPNISLINPSQLIKIQTEYGILIISNNVVKLLDFENNKLSEWKNIQINNLFNSTKAQIKPLIIRDSVLLFYNFEKLDSIILPISHFKLISQIYNPIKVKSDSTILFICAIFILLILCVLIYIYYKSGKKSNANLFTKNGITDIDVKIENDINSDNINNLNSILESNEIYLLAQIISNNNRISLEQLNYIL